jgi:hypothetical protein
LEMNDYLDPLIFGLKAVCLTVVVTFIAGVLCKFMVIIFLKGWMLI